MTQQKTTIQQPKQPRYKIEFRTIEGADKFYLILDSDIYTERVRFLWHQWNVKRIQKLGFTNVGTLIEKIDWEYQRWKNGYTKKGESGRIPKCHHT